MKHTNRSAFVLACLSLATVVSADTVVIKSGEGGGIPYAKVKVIGIEGEDLQYRTSSGNETSKPLAQVSQITVDDEPAFNDAEAAYLAGDFPKATDAYQKAVRTTSKDWIKDRSAARLVEAAGKTNRFDAAVTGFVTLVQRSPTVAASVRPQVPAEKSPALDSAVRDVEGALSDGKLSTEQKTLLLSFELELQRARQDSKAAGEVAERLLKISAGDASNPAAAMALADLKLNMAKLALDEKNYQKAFDEIDKNRAVFTDPNQQAGALYCLAEAKYGLAGDTTDENKLKDLALSYMRVVAHFKGQTGTPYVAESLVKTADIMNRLKKPAAAKELYSQVVASYPDNPAAKIAQTKLSEMK